MVLRNSLPNCLEWVKNVCQEKSGQGARGELFEFILI